MWKNGHILELRSIFVFDIASLFEEVADTITEVDTVLRVLSDSFKLILCLYSRIYTHKAITQCTFLSIFLNSFALLNRFTHVSFSVRGEKSK